MMPGGGRSAPAAGSTAGTAAPRAISVAPRTKARMGHLRAWGEPPVGCGRTYGTAPKQLRPRGALACDLSENVAQVSHLIRLDKVSAGARVARSQVSLAAARTLQGQGLAMHLRGPRIAPSRGRASALVVLLHGYGANGEDLIALG